jgi:hypothetical protein
MSDGPSAGLVVSSHWYIKSTNITEKTGRPSVAEDDEGKSAAASEQ